jgi:hypothetical protein
MSAKFLQPKVLRDRSSSMLNLPSRQLIKSHNLSARQCQALAQSKIYELIEFPRDFVSDRHATIDFECKDCDTACGCIYWPTMPMTRQHRWQIETGSGRTWTKIDRDCCKDGILHGKAVHELLDALADVWERDPDHWVSPYVKAITFKFEKRDSE